MLRYKFLSHKFLNLAHRAASYPECSLLVNNALDMLSKQVEEQINACTSTVDPCTVCTDVMPPNDLLSNARLKKKEVRVRVSKRKRTWLDKKRKTRKKGQSKKGNSSMVLFQKKTAFQCYYLVIFFFFIF